jgi:integrase
VRVRVSKSLVRAVPITEDAVNALRAALAAAPRRGLDEPVFFSPRTGDRMRGDSITHALPRILEAAGLGHLTPHALRHGAATLMLTGGASMRTIAEQLGHRNPSLTARVYAHVVPEQQRAAVGLLERRRAK